MKIALTNVRSFNKNAIDYFMPTDLSETFSTCQTCSSILMDPNELLKNLGFESKYLDTPPFSFIRSYAPIWEYYLVALFINEKGKIIERNYKYMRMPPAKMNCLDNSYRGVGNKEFSVWKKNYSRFTKNQNEHQKEIKKLKEKVEKFVTELIERKCSIRQYSPYKLDFLKRRKDAASHFLNFLIRKQFNKDELTKEEVEKLVQTKDKYLWLLKNVKNDQSHKHILSVSLLMCLYGYKEASVSKKFCEEVKRNISKLNVNSDLKNKIIILLSRTIQNSPNDYVSPPLSSIYRERDRISIQQRLAPWMQLLKGVINAQKK